MAKLNPNPYPGDWSFSASDQKQDTQFAAIPKDRVIRFQVADGYAYYFVQSMKPLRLQHIPFGDAYRISDAHIRGLRTQDVAEMIEREKRFAALWGKR